AGRQPFQFQPPLGDFKGADRDIQTDDLLELLLLQQLADPPAFAAAEVQDALGAAGPKSRHDRNDALLVQAKRRLQHVLSPVAYAAVLLGDKRFLFLYKPGERFAEQAWLELQVTPRDLFFLRMSGQPARALAEQLLHFIFA